MFPERIADGDRAAAADRAAGTGAGPSDDYDLLPYPAMPITLSQPSHLGALATLFGIDPPPIESARVLELGCASGGNIIPLAARFPLARFLGIDLARRHIEDGTRRIRDLDLANITLRQGDLTDLDLAGEQFDYVICHGVFSWVPRTAQDAIFRICRETLAPDGVATISYNVLPGWHLRMVIRDLCRHYAGTEGTPLDRVARARAALRRIAESSDAAEPYGQLLRTEVQRLKDVPSAYILGEFLTRNNAPCHVRTFIERAGQAELDYLCEADLSAAVPPSLDPETRRRIDAIANSDRAAAEQHIDFLTGRLFRRSVLVRRQPGRRLPATPDPDRMRRLHLASPMRLDEAQSTEQLAVFTDQQARPVSTRDPAARAVFARLAAVFPATVTLDELIDDALRDVVDSGVTSRVERASRLCRAVMAVVIAGRVSISLQRMQAGRADQEQPAVWQLARKEAASGQPWVTSRRHTGVPAHPIIKGLVPWLDGSNDRTVLRARLTAALEDGTIEVPELATDQRPSRERTQELAGEYIDRTLRYLERQGLLEADSGAGEPPAKPL